MAGCCLDCPRRYGVVALGFVGLLLSIGYRACYALVMVHLVESHPGQPDQQSIFPSCTTNSTVDRQALAGSWTSDSVQLSHTSYFAGSFLMQLPGGVLATRFSSKRVCGLSILISSVLFLLLPTAIHHSQPAVFIIRVLQGLVEGCSVPALNGVISAWAPKAEKGRLITIAYAGAYISPAAGLVITGLCTCYVSWNSIFYIYGGCGAVWSVVWLLVVYDSPSLVPSLGESERRIFNINSDLTDAPAPDTKQPTQKPPIPWRGVLTSWPVYAIIVGAFCRNWIFSMLITQQPQFFRDVFGMTSADIGLLSAVPHVLMMIVVITGGFSIDMLIKRKIFSTTVARKFSETIGFGVEAACVFAIAFAKTGQNAWVTAFVLLCVGVGFSGLAISGYQVNPLDLAPQYASVLTGLSRLGTLGAILSTTVASQLIGGVMTHGELVKQWQTVFIVAGSIHLAGVIFYAIFASGERQPWSVSTVAMRLPSPACSDYEEASRETEKLLRRRLAHRRPHLLDDNDEFGSTMRFLHTI